MAIDVVKEEQLCSLGDEAAWWSYWRINKESPSDGGGVKGATLSTEKQDINLEEIILQFVDTQKLWCVTEL